MHHHRIRDDFHEIWVQQGNYCSETGRTYPPSLILQFETIPSEYSSSKEFGFPDDPLPEGLQIFDVNEDGVFLDYKSLLEASALLQNDLLIPFFSSS
jgi:hypothetical protein